MTINTGFIGASLVPRFNEIPLATIEAISELTNVLKDAGCEASISQHQTSRGVSLNLGTRLAPMNPVFIVKGKLK